MSPETLQTVSNWVTFIGVLLAGLGSLGGYQFGQRVSVLRDQQAATEKKELDGKIQTLLDGNSALSTRLAPFEELAKRQFPNASPDAALVGLREKLEALGQRTDKLESSVAPRRPSTAQAADLTARLRAGGAQTVTVMTVLGDPEAIGLSTSLKSALAEAGWQVTSIDGVTFHEPFVGVTISVSGFPEPAGAELLKSALSAVGIKVRGSVDPGQAPDAVRLVIGSKAQ